MQKLVSASALALLLMIPVGTALAANEPATTDLPSGVLPISDYYNQSVYDPKDNKIVDINDLLLEKEGIVSAVPPGSQVGPSSPSPIAATTAVTDPKVDSWRGGCRARPSVVSEFAPKTVARHWQTKDRRFDRLT